MSHFKCIINTIKQGDYKKLFGESCELMKQKHLNHVRKYGVFKSKRDAEVCFGRTKYNTIRKFICIEPPTKLINVSNVNDFLAQLVKFNDTKSMENIRNYIARISPSTDKIGFNYILRNYDESKSKWYKVGETGRKDPQTRANEWGYGLLESFTTSDRKIMEKLVHNYLNFAHVIRPAMHGKGKTEIEWFHVKFDLLKKTIECVLEKYDPYYTHFKLFGIRGGSNLDEKFVTNQFEKLSHLPYPNKISINIDTLILMRDELLDFISGNNILGYNSNNYDRTIVRCDETVKRNIQYDTSDNERAIQILIGYTFDDIMTIKGCGSVLSRYLYNGLEGVTNHDEYMKKEITQFKLRRKTTVIKWIINNVIKKV